MTRRRRPTAGEERDRGAVLVLFALVLVALIAVAAIVVDLGMARETRREAQSDADLSALAAGWYLAGNASASYAPNPRAACEAALNSVVTNVNDWPSGASLPCDPSLPATSASCTATTTPITVTSTGSDPYVLTVSWPVPDGEISRAEFSAAQGVDDGVPCERMSVQLQRKDPTFFAGVLGRDGETIRARAVVRVNPQEGAEGVPALLMTERTRCGTLQTSGGGNVVAGVHVLASGPQGQPPTQFGFVHSDSQGSGGTSPCTSNNNAGGHTVYGTALPSGGGPSIRVDGVPASGDTPAQPGRIALYSLAAGGRPGADFDPACTWIAEDDNSGCAGSGLSVDPIGGGVISRRPADEKYGSRIDSLYETARGRAFLNSGSYAFISGGDCSPPDGASYGGNLYVDCPNGFDVANNRTVTFTGANVAFRGTVSVAGTLLMPNARSVSIAGCGGGNNECSSLSVSGTLIVNGEQTATSCLVDRPIRDADGRFTSLAVFGGAFAIDSNARVKLCQTSVFLMYGSGANVGGAPAAPPPSFARVELSSGAPNCSESRPCPALTAANLPAGFGGRAPLITMGNAQAVDWIAPNQGAGGPSDASPYEDLALWTEAIGTTSSTRCSTSGQSASIVAGVFFHPNCDFTFTGQGDNSNEFNAQFFGRTLDVSGQGILRLRPNPEDSILVPLAGIARLIR